MTPHRHAVEATSSAQAKIEIKKIKFSGNALSGIANAFSKQLEGFIERTMQNLICKEVKDLEVSMAPINRIGLVLHISGFHRPLRRAATRSLVPDAARRCCKYRKRASRRPAPILANLALFYSAFLASS